MTHKRLVYVHNHICRREGEQVTLEVKVQLGYYLRPGVPVCEETDLELSRVRAGVPTEG